MTFTLAPQIEEVRRRAAALTDDALAERAYETDRTGNYPWDVQSILANEGFLGLHVPVEFGGAGLGLTGMCVAMEEISRMDASTCGILDACGLGSYALLLGGTDEQRRRWLPRIATGRSMVSFALTERAAGSDPASMLTHARRDNDGSFVLQGSKCFIGNAGPADLYVVFAKLDDQTGMVALLLERGQSGFFLGKREDKMGLRGTETYELHFDECVVPPTDVVGEIGRGFRLALSVLDVGRITIGAQALGIARGALELATAWAMERRQFGTRIADFQATRFKIADIATDIEGVANMLYALTTAYDADPAVPGLTAKASALKVYATEAARRAVNHSLQIHGGYGYMKEQAIERIYRDQRIIEIYEGTSEIQRHVLARTITSETFTQHLITDQPATVLP